MGGQRVPVSSNLKMVNYFLGELRLHTDISNKPITLASLLMMWNQARVQNSDAWLQRESSCCRPTYMCLGGALPVHIQLSSE
jgi:hypothetical protein